MRKAEILDSHECHCKAIEEVIESDDEQHAIYQSKTNLFCTEISNQGNHESQDLYHVDTNQNMNIIFNSTNVVTNPHTDPNNSRD